MDVCLVGWMVGCLPEWMTRFLDFGWMSGWLDRWVDELLNG
jgi:hypothetical protein